MTAPIVDGAAVITAAESYIGENGSRFQTRFGFGRDDAWCCMFVHACLADAGADWFPSTAWVPYVADWAKANGCLANRDQSPPPGSPVIFDWDGDGLADHIGIVTGYSDPYVLTIEGNAGGPSNSTSTVKRWSRGRDVIEGFLWITPPLNLPPQPASEDGESTMFSPEALAELDRRQSAVVNRLESTITTAISAAANATIAADDNIRNDILNKAAGTKNDILAFLTAVSASDAKKIIDSFAAELRAGVKP